MDFREDAVFDSIRIDVAAGDIALRIDPVKGGKGRSGIIETDKLIRRHQEEAMSDARGVSVASYDPIKIVVAKQDCPVDPSGSIG